MTSILKIVGVVMVVGVLCVGTMALAADFVWDANSVQTSWLTPAHWDLDDSYPQNANDNATIDAAGNLCTFDPGSDVTINNLTLAGASPTKRKLHIKDGTLTAETFDLQDYAELDVDADLTVNSRATLSGSVWIDVANGVTFTAKDGAGNIHDGIFVDGTQTRLILTTGSTGTLEAWGIRIDANAANEQRALKLNGGTLAIKPSEYLWIESDPDADNKRAKFWLAVGGIDFGTSNWIQLVGGGSNARRAEMDLDQDLTLLQNGFTIIKGYVTIDIAAGKMFTSSVTTISGTGGPAVLTVTSGSGGVMNTQDVS